MSVPPTSGRRKAKLMRVTGMSSGGFFDEFASVGEELKFPVPGGRVRFSFQPCGDPDLHYVRLTFEPLREGLVRYERP